jgi:hypothetical protein
MARAVRSVERPLRCDALTRGGTPRTARRRLVRPRRTIPSFRHHGS